MLPVTAACGRPSSGRHRGYLCTVVRRVRPGQVPRSRTVGQRRHATTATHSAAAAELLLISGAQQTKPFLGRR